MYKNNSSANARDFLLKLYYLVGRDFKVLQKDNGNKFNKYFQMHTKSLI